MEKVLLYPIMIFLLIACTNKSVQTQSDCSDLERKNTELESHLKQLQDSISILKFPASDRLQQIKELVSKEDLVSAKSKISELKNIFPNSNETKLCSDVEILIQKKEEQKRLEEERIKALGYKVFKDNATVKVGSVTLVTSGFNFGRTYTFGSCSDVGEYSYDTADKDNTYLLISLSMSTKDKYASVPSLGLYKIIDGKLAKIGFVREEYTSWTSYGAKIGNYSDDSHDFSKVSTVRYKLACEISQDEAKLPLVFLAKQDASSVDDKLTIDDVNNEYVVIKIINRNNL